MIFEFAHHKIDVDVEKTKAFYETAEYITEGCECQMCRNFEKAIELVDDDVKAVFQKMGIDMKKAREVWGNSEPKKSKMCYSGFYHVCGRVLEGGFVWEEINDHMSYLIEEKSMFSINEDFKIGFADRIDLLEEGFPEPVVQLEISADIPWVLEEKYIE